MKLKVAKDKYNSFGNFNYYNVSDIFTALKTLLKKYNAVLCFGDTEILLVGNRFYVAETAILRVKGEEIRVQAKAREAEKPKAKMDEGQLSGSTSSYGLIKDWQEMPADEAIAKMTEYHSSLETTD